MDSHLDSVIDEFEATHKLSQRSHRTLFALDKQCTCDSHTLISQEPENPNCFSGLLSCDAAVLLREELDKAGCIDIKRPTDYTLKDGPIWEESGESKESSSSSPFSGFCDSDANNFYAFSALLQALFANTHFRNTIYNFVTLNSQGESRFEPEQPILKFVNELCKVFLDMEFSLRANVSIEGLVSVLTTEIPQNIDISILYDAVIDLLFKGFSFSETKDRTEPFTPIEIVRKIRCIECEAINAREDNLAYHINLPIDGLEKAPSIHILEDILQKIFPSEYIEEECSRCIDGILERSLTLGSAPPLLTLNIFCPSPQGPRNAFVIPYDLDIKEFVDKSNTNEKSYELLSVICRVYRSGSDESHYVTYTKKCNKWWYFDNNAPGLPCEVSNLPFHLVDSAGTFITPNNKNFVYNYSSKTFVESAKLAQDPVLTPCMMFYQRKDISDEKPNCPAELSNSMKEEYFKFFQEYKDNREFDREQMTSVIQKRVFSHVDAYEKLAKTFAQIAPGENYYWVPKEWLEHVKNSTLLSSDGTKDDKTTLDLAPFACKHGLLDIRHLRSMKRISVPAWNRITESIALKEGSPVFDSSSECDLCAEAFIEGIIDLRLRKVMKQQFDEENAELNSARFCDIPKDDTFYYVSAVFYRAFKRLKELPLTFDVHPTKDITCAHGNMKFGSKSNKLKKVGQNTWDWIYPQFAEKPVPFTRGSVKCADCRLEEEKIARDKEVLKELLYYKNMDADTDVDPGVLYFLVDREWYNSVRNYTCFNGEKPEPFDFSGLLCPHGKVPFNLETELLPDGNLAYLSETEWVRVSML